jgi:hypothetical protein
MLYFHKIKTLTPCVLLSYNIPLVEEYSHPYENLCLHVCIIKPIIFIVVSAATVETSLVLKMAVE